MGRTKRYQKFALAICAVAGSAAATHRSYADGFESQLLDDLIERGRPSLETAPRADGPSSPAPLASAAEDMRRAADAMRGVDASDWDATFEAQDAALAKLRRLIESVDAAAAAGQSQLTPGAQDDQPSAADAEGVADPPPAPEDAEPNQGKSPSGAGEDPPPSEAPREGQTPGGSSDDGQENDDGPGRSPGQTGGSNAAAGGGTAAAAPRDEAVEVRLREAVDRWQKMQWGMLPPRLREQVGGGGAAEFAEGYERSTAAYFEELGRRLGGQSR